MFGANDCRTYLTFVNKNITEMNLAYPKMHQATEFQNK